MDQRQQIYQMLRSQGCRMTPHKRILVDLFLDSPDRFLTIAELAALLPPDVQMDTTTIYRNVQKLEESGLVESRLDDKGVMSYLLCQSHGTHHHHLICTGCGSIISIPCHPAIWQDIARQHRFLESHHKVEIYGLCAHCQAKGLKLNQTDGCKHTT
jgi:Fur family ferric uptake transcriptional regulator